MNGRKQDTATGTTQNRWLCHCLVMPAPQLQGRGEAKHWRSQRRLRHMVPSAPYTWGTRSRLCSRYWVLFSGRVATTSALSSPPTALPTAALLHNNDIQATSRSASEGMPVRRPRWRFGLGSRKIRVLNQPTGRFVMRRIGAVVVAMAIVAPGVGPAGAQAGQAKGAGGLRLAVDGVPNMPIVISPKASPHCREVAQELAQYLGRITGGTFEIRTGDGAAGIVLGTLAEFPCAELAEGLQLRNSYDGKEAYAIRSQSERLLLIGATDLGVSHAAFRLLEEVGCRWLFPAGEWEIVPSRPTLSVRAGRNRPAGPVGAADLVGLRLLRRSLSEGLSGLGPPQPHGRVAPDRVRARLARDYRIAPEDVRRTPRVFGPGSTASGKGRSSASAIPRCGSSSPRTCWSSSAGSRSGTWFRWRPRTAEGIASARPAGGWGASRSGCSAWQTRWPAR